MVWPIWRALDAARWVSKAWKNMRAGLAEGVGDLVEAGGTCFGARGVTVREGGAQAVGRCGVIGRKRVAAGRRERGLVRHAGSSCDRVG